MACSSSSSQVDKWQDKSLAETNLHMLENEIICDVTFLVGEKREPVPAHKFMLVSRSPVFYAMFCGPLAETQSEVLVPDIDAEIMKILIRFLYTTSCDPTSETVMATLYAAKKYEVESLKQLCLDFLADHVDNENVCMILQQAITFDEQPLVQSSLSYIFENCENVLQSQGFLSLGKEALRRIIQSDDMKTDELSIYNACVKWAKQQLTEAGEPTTDHDVRKRLGELIYTIRFPLLSMEDFVTNVSQTNILSDAEKVAIFHSYALKKYTDGQFVTRPRYPRRNVEIKRFIAVQGGWAHANLANVISFRCSENGRLVGVYLFTPESPGSGLNGRLEISDDDNVLSCKSINLKYSTEATFKEVSIEPPVILKKDKLYYLSQTCEGQNTFYGVNAEEEIIEQGVTFKFLSTPLNKCGDPDSKRGFDRKYEVWQLERECWDFLDRYIDEENACAILQQAVDFDDKTSIESSLSYILDHEEKVMKSQGFLLLNKEALRMILKSDEIFLDELSINQACLKWAKYKLSEVGKPTTDQAVRESLGKLINLIRFPLMSQKEFTKHVSNTNILTAEEKVAVFQSNILRKDTGEGPVSCRERCVKVDWVIERFTNVECDWVHRNDYNSVSFTCSKNVRLIGVILFTPSKPGAIEGTLTLVDSNYKELFLKTSNLNTIQ